MHGNGSVMRAGYLLAPGRIEVRDEPVPQPGEGEIVLRVRAALTDGTDLKAFRRGHPQMPMPTRFGHEFSGDVVAVGSGVANFRSGDPVMAVHSAPCGRCAWCSRAEEELCESVMATKILGAYAEFLTLPAHIVAVNAFHKPASLSYSSAAFLEPLACVVHALEKLAPRNDARIVIVGDGGFGLLHALVVRALGLPDPILVGHRPQRLAIARAYGFAHVLDGRAVHAERKGADETASLRDAVWALTGGEGADAAIEVTGQLAVWEAMPALVRRGGTIALFGGLPSGTRVTFDAARLHYDELRIISPFHFTPRAVRRAYDLLAAGSLDVAPLVTATYRLDELADAFSALEASRDGVKFAIVT